MRDVIFACLLGSVETEKEAFRLAQSIRTFGGEFCFNPIWMFSQSDEDHLPEATRRELFSLGVRLVTFTLDPAGVEFPFLPYVASASLAETLAQGQSSFLVFMATDTLVLQAPYDFLLSPGKSLGACPVHLKLLGSGGEEPIDAFWQLIYQHCRVDPGRIFPMHTIVDTQTVRAYFNSGLLVVRPERGLLRLWQKNFDRLYRLPQFETYCQQELYAIFMHQAVLAGTILSALKSDEIQQLPFEMNYPMHLHARVPASRKPTNLNQLVTCRYEDFAEVFGGAHLDELIQIDAPMKEWLLAQL